MKKNRFGIILSVLVILLASCGPTANVDWELSVGGAVSNPYSISFDELIKFPIKNYDDVFMDKSTGEDENTSWSGIPLEVLFEKAGIDPDFVTLTAVAADGYAIEISRDEIEGGFIALKEKGEWIYKSDPEHGPIRLVVPKTPANRWVFQITEIIINK